MLTVVDEYSRECLAIVPGRTLKSEDVIETLAGLFISRAVRGWLKDLGVETLFIEPGSPWENGYCESFNGKLRDELLNREIFYTLEEAKVLIENWRQEYNTIRPHSSLGYWPPAPEALAVVAGEGLD
jgi:putative transposase